MTDSYDVLGETFPKQGEIVKMCGFFFKSGSFILSGPVLPCRREEERRLRRAQLKQQQIQRKEDEIQKQNQANQVPLSLNPQTLKPEENPKLRPFNQFHHLGFRV